MDREEHLQKLRKFLTCPQCERVISSTPQTLPCFHSFCTDCVSRGFGVITHHDQEYMVCPQCGTLAPGQGFIPFGLMKDLVQLYEAATTHQNICHYCEEEETEANWWCVVCKINLCDRCKRFHERTPNCRSHAYRACSEPSDAVVDKVFYCSEHPDQRIEEYCTTCRKCICCRCKLSSHSNHPTKTLRRMVEHFGSIMRGPLKSLQNSMELVEDEEAYFNKELNRIQREYESVKTNYDLTRQRLLAYIEVQYAAGVVKLEEEKEKNIEKIETHIKKLIHKRKAKERLIGTADITLTTSKGVSLLYGLSGGIIQKITMESNQNHVPQNIKVTYPKHIKCELVQGQEVSMGSISYKESSLAWVPPGRIRNLNIKFEDVFQGFSGSTELTQLDGNPQRLAFIQGDIWIPSYDPSLGYQVFDVIRSSVHSVNHAELTGVYAFHQTSRNEVVAACTRGLFSLNTEGVVMYKIAEGTFTDVTSVGPDMVAVEKVSCCVIVCKCIENRWISRNQFQVERNSAYHETVHIINEFIYICFSSGKLSKYTFQGQLVEEYGSTVDPAASQFHDPYISGSDKRQSLIVCNSDDHQFQVKGPQGNWQVFNVQNFFDFPRDMLVVRDCVYILCGWFPRKLAKFSFQ